MGAWRVFYRKRWETTQALPDSQTKDEGPQCCGVGASLESIRSGLAAPRAWRRSNPPGGKCFSSTSLLYSLQRLHVHAIGAAAATLPRACLADVTEVEPVFFLIVEPPLTHCVEKGGIFLWLYDCQRGIFWLVCQRGKMRVVYYDRADVRCINTGIVQLVGSPSSLRTHWCTSTPGW